MDLVNELIVEHHRVREQLDPFKQSCVLITGENPSAAALRLRKLACHLEEMILLNHINKEEELLFPELAKIGVSVDHGPIGQLLEEHKKIREYFKNLQEIIVKIAEGNLFFMDLFCHQLKKLVQLTEFHSYKEELVLFEIAKQHLYIKNQPISWTAKKCT